MASRLERSDELGTRFAHSEPSEMKGKLRARTNCAKRGQNCTESDLGLDFIETLVPNFGSGSGCTSRSSCSPLAPPPPAHSASTDQIVELRDQGLTWTEVAKQVDMTVSGVWSRYRKAQPPKSQRLGRWQQVVADALDQNLAIGVRAAVADHLGRAPTRAELTAARPAALGRARVLRVPGSDAGADPGDRTYLVLAKPNVIMNDIRLVPSPSGAVTPGGHFSVMGVDLNPWPQNGRRIAIHNQR
jgi:predicted DNA-binding transcriptional regulator AlpA